MSQLCLNFLIKTSTKTKLFKNRIEIVIFYASSLKYHLVLVKFNIVVVNIVGSETYYNRISFFILSNQYFLNGYNSITSAEMLVYFFFTVYRPHTLDQWSSRCTLVHTTLHEFLFGVHETHLEVHEILRLHKKILRVRLSM